MIKFNSDYESSKAMNNEAKRTKLVHIGSISSFFNFLNYFLSKDLTLILSALGLEIIQYKT